MKARAKMPVATQETKAFALCCLEYETPSVMGSELDGQDIAGLIPKEISLPMRYTRATKPILAGARYTGRGYAVSRW